MSKRKHNLLVVAHPDDETLFFGGLLLNQKGRNWHIVCVTDGNADGLGQKRHEQFRLACKALGTKHFTFFELPDRFESRLDLDLIKNKLSLLEKPNEVFTHGPLGEYGHPHHQDVSMAVHDFFSEKKIPVYSVAHNCSADLTIRLDKNTFAKKSKILAQIYFSETERFINFVPSTPTESFVRLKLTEVRSLYNYFIGNGSLDEKSLQKFRWFLPYLTTFKMRVQTRPF